MKRFALLAVAVLALTGCSVHEPPPVSEKVAKFYEEHQGFTKPADPLQAVFIGDSYTYGYGAQSGQNWASIVARYHGWGEHNFGYGGTGYMTTADKTRCHLDACPAYPENVAQIDAAIDPDYVIVAGGRNDSIRDVAAYQDAANRTFTDIRAKFPRATILAMNPIAEVESFVTGKAEAVQAAVTAVGGTYIDIGQPVMGQENLLSNDAVHPNYRGYTAIAEAFIAKCGPELCKPTPAPDHWAPTS